MSKRRKITYQMIQECFGPQAGIEEEFFGDGFRVTTPTGGDVKISQAKCEVHAGGDDVYEAVTRLSTEAWGGMTASGPPEAVAAFIAHGEALGMPVTPEVKAGGGCLRVLVAPFVFMMVAGAVSAAGGGPGIGFVAAALVTGWVWNSMKESSEREGRRQAQALRYPFPRIHGSARYSSDEDLRKGGLI